MAAARLAWFGEIYYKVPFIARYEFMKDSPREMASAVISTMIGALQSRIARRNAGRLYRVIPQLEMSLLRTPAAGKIVVALRPRDPSAKERLLFQRGDSSV
jgi:hypothetical protein